MRPSRLTLVANGLWLMTLMGSCTIIALRGPDGVALAAIALMAAASMLAVALAGRIAEARERRRLARLAEALAVEQAPGAALTVEKLVLALCTRLERANWERRSPAVPADSGPVAAGPPLPILSNGRPMMAAGTGGAAQARPGGGEPMDTGEFALSDSAFERVRQRVYAVAGISLSDAKRTLVVSRLSKILRQRGIGSFDAYLDFLERQAGPEDAQAFVNALTTNLTRFYREDHHFEHLGQYVEELLARRPRTGPDGRPRLRIWSAGCSSGQEPYTIAMHLTALLPELRHWDFRILATDIDTQMLARAAEGRYPDTELSGLPPARAAQFEQAGEGQIRVPGPVRRLVAFKTLNLMDEPWPMRGPFDAIFCRNVAIYFDKQTQQRLFARLTGLLAPEGCLYIGHSENPGAAGAPYRNLGRTILRLRPDGKARSAA